MTVALQVAFACLALAGGWFLAHRLLPWLVRALLRLCRIEIRVSPVMQKRVQRFRRIRRGYWAFIGMTSLIATSLFLEFLVNNQALVVYYDGRWACPAARQWTNEALPFADVPYYLPSEDFGLVGEAPLRCREFASYCENPDRLLDLIEEHRKELVEAEAKFDKTKPPQPPRPVEEPRDPGPGASEDERQDYEDALLEYEDYLADLEYYQQDVGDYEFERNDLETRREIIARLERSYPVFRDGRAWALLPIYPYGPDEHLLDLPGRPPHRPLEAGLLLGSTGDGADVLVQLLYGFRISIIFAVLVASVGYALGVLIGGVMGYYGRWVDIGLQRVVEIWGAIPFLFTLMILAAILQPNLIKLALLLIILRAWLGITYTIRGEFYREKAKDYVQAAIAIGVSDWKILVRHILPNALVPIVSFAPFAIVGYISILVSLDYLGFGLPPGTPSWGYLFKQGHENLRLYPHLIIVPAAAEMAALFTIVLIGESVREAFDPKVFSRLR